MVNPAKKEVDFGSASEEILDLIAKHRNWLVHKVASQIWIYTYKEEAEKKLVHSLRELEQFFHSAAELIYAAIKERAAARGLPVQTIEAAVRQMFETETIAQQKNQPDPKPRVEPRRLI